MVVEIKEQKRSLDQNAHLWAILGDISEQVEWYGQRLLSEDWKHILTAGLKREQRVAPGIDGGFVVLGTSTSRMTKAELSELIEFAYAFGASKGVRFVSQSETT
jgi:hypothetical protein